METKTKVVCGSFVCGIITLVITLGLLFVISPRANAAINQQINFQGKLTNPDGTNVTNGSYSIRFRIYTHATNDAANTCSANSCKWEETQGTVSVTDGVFQVALGSVNTALATQVDFNVSGLWLGIKVGSDAEMTPRIAFTAAPYAFNSEKLNGIASTGYVQLGQNATAQTDGSTNVGIFINKTSTGNQLQLQSASTDVFTIANNGNVVLGNNAPKTITVTTASAGNAGSSLSLTAGAAGTGASALGGGDLNLNAGAGGGTNGAGGSVWLVPGAANGTGTPGAVIASVQANAATAFVIRQSSFQLFAVDTTSTDMVSVGSGTNGVNFRVNTGTSNQLSVLANGAPTVDMVSISNSTGIATSGVSGLQIDYVGGNIGAGQEASAARVDLTPGSTGTWNGFRVVANATGAGSGVSEYGVNLDGPTAAGAGTEVAISIDANWDAGLQLGAKTSDPGTVPADNIFVYARKIAGRSMLRQKGSSGVSFAYQPALFEQAITYQGPNTTTSVTTFGSSWTIDTTASHPAASETFGFSTNFATAATANDTAGVAEAAVQHYRGSVANGANGFFYVARLGLPDANYGSGATGARIWTGLTSNTAAAMTAGDNPTGDYVGFQYSTNRGDTTWNFITKDNTTQSTPVSTLAIAQNKVYDFYIYVAPQGSTIFWRIDNITDGTTQEGSTTTNLPRTTIAMRAGTGLQTLTTTARNIRVLKHYVESDR